MTGRILLIIGIVLSYSPALFAQTKGAYLGVGLGQSTATIDAMAFKDLPYSYLFTGRPIFFTASQDNSSTKSSWALYGGYQFNRYLAIEGLYQPLGEYTRSGSNKGLVDPNLVKAAGLGFTNSGSISDLDTLTLQGYGLAAVGGYPVANYIYLLGKAGVFYWNGKLDRTTIFTSNTAAPKHILLSESDSGYSPIFGVGLRIDVSRRLSVRGEWSHISSVGGGLSTGQTSVNITSFSAQINF